MVEFIIDVQGGYKEQRICIFLALESILLLAYNSELLILR